MIMLQKHTTEADWNLEDERQSSVAMQNENQFTEEIMWLVLGVERCLPV